MGSAWQFNTAIGGDVHASQGGGALPEPGERIRVLMLAANPQSTTRLAIDEEARQITERLRLSRDRDAFDLITCLAVQPMDLLQQLNQHSPHIVHVSGHGTEQGDLMLSAGNGTGRRVSAEALADVLRVTGDHLRVVVLNACWSAAAAKAIVRHVDYVIGMSSPITDRTATVFAAAFYSALGFGHPVPRAFDQAVAALGLDRRTSRDAPRLVARPAATPHLKRGRA